MFKNTREIMIVFLLLVFSVPFILPQEIQLDPIVQLPQGKIRGHVLKSSQNKPYYAFQDVPFARAAVGDLRFKEAQPPLPWNDIKNTTKNLIKCVEFKKGGFAAREDNLEESEDCFYANVFTPYLPNNNSSELLPVFFMIYGGGFIAGNGDFDYVSPAYFMNYNLIMVVTSYRLGPLGFIHNKDDVFPGSLAIKDINYGLKWTNDIIARFGGDPKKITIGGISSGAIAAGALLISDKSAGLFRGAILQSGSMLCQWGLQKYPDYYAHELAMKLNSSINKNSTSEQLLDVLKNAPVQDLIDANNEISIPSGMEVRAGHETNGKWLPVMEKKNASYPFITEVPLITMQKGNFNKVPLIIGFSSEEDNSSNQNKPTLRKEQAIYTDNDTMWAVNDLFNIPLELKRIAGAEMRSVFTNKTFSEDPAAMIKFRSAEGFRHPVIRHAEIQSKFTDVYLYQLSHKGPLGYMNGTLETSGTYTVGHAEDETYQYGRTTMDNDVYPPSDILTRERIVKMWSNFIIQLDPTPQKDPLLQDIKWPKFNQTNHKYLNFNTTLSIDDSGFEKFLKWKAIMEKYEKY